MNKATQDKSHISEGMVVQGAPPGDLLECPFLSSDLQMASWPHREGPEDSVGTDLPGLGSCQQGHLHFSLSWRGGSEIWPEHEVQL